MVYSCFTLFIYTHSDIHLHLNAIAEFHNWIPSLPYQIVFTLDPLMHAAVGFHTLITLSDLTQDQDDAFISTCIFSNTYGPILYSFPALLHFDPGGLWLYTLLPTNQTPLNLIRSSEFVRSLYVIVYHTI